MTIEAAETAETVAQFRERARSWLSAHMPTDGRGSKPGRDTVAAWDRDRELQRMLYDGGFAGICFPREYGGLGLGYAYKKAFDTAAVGFEMPVGLNVPCLAICCATILDMGTEAQKRQHISAALRGDEVLVQLLSEPSGGSDLAGVITRAERRGDGWVLNGAKTWSTFAFAADYGLCLARTDWGVPKHEGLTMFLVPLHAPGVELKRITQVDGTADFCEEFFDDVELSDDAVLGAPGRGWVVASRQLHHERLAMGDGSEFTVGAGIEASQNLLIDLVGLVERAGRTGDERARELAGTAAAVAGDGQDMLGVGVRFLGRQIANIGGGTTEMARNVISERVLGLPREATADRGMPFKDVPRSRSL